MGMERHLEWAKAKMDMGSDVNGVRGPLLLFLLNAMADLSAANC